MADLITTSKNYMFKMLDIQAIEGMKALIMDTECTQMVALTCSQTDIIMRDVVLVGSLHNHIQQDSAELKATAHLKAVIVLRPVRESIAALCKHLAQPRFSSYYVFFTNVVPQNFLQQVAEADTHEVIRQVHEYYLDFFAMSDNLFTVQCPQISALHHNKQYWRLQDKAVYTRMIDGITAYMLSQKVRPQIRYVRTSPLAQAVAQGVLKRIQENEQLFQFPNQANSLLLINDRCEDPVTPLVQQWTYKSMVHEQFTINNNIVNLKDFNVKKDLEEIVLSTNQDDFYKKNQFLSFGDMGSCIKEYVMQYAQQSQLTGKLDSLQDMQNFVESFPALKSLSGNLSKHLALFSEISRLVTRFSLMEISELEQDIACPGTGGNHSQIAEALGRVLDDSRIRFQNKLNLVILYALRFENDRNNRVQQFTSKLNHIAPDQVFRSKTRAVEEVLRLYGAAKRTGDLFDTGFWSKTNSLLKGVDNIFQRHRPKVVELVDSVLKNKFKAKDYPRVDDETDERLNKPSSILVFTVGGITYSEQCALMELNAMPENQGISILLGSNTVHNSASFVKDLLKEEDAVESEHVALDLL